MSSADKPEDAVPPIGPKGGSQSGAVTPDLTITQWKEGDLEAGSEAGSAGSNDERPKQQSVFSRRSGIQDPLRKGDDVSPETEPAEDIVPIETPMDEAQQEEEEEQPATPERKRRRVKGRPKLVKSKRQLDRARRRQMNYLQRRREQKKLRVFYSRIRLIFKLCFAVLWGVLLWQMVHSAFWLYQQPSYSVKDQLLVQSKQLMPLIKPWVGKPLYAIDTGRLAQEIETQFEMVDRATVRRHIFPAYLEIQLHEKQPWAEVYLEDKQASQSSPTSKDNNKDQKSPKPAALLVQDGIVSLANYQYQPDLYRGVKLEQLLVRPKQQFALTYLERLRELIWQAGQIKGLHLVKVDVRNPNRVVFHYQEIPVILGRINDSSSQRLARLIPLLPKINEFRDGIESVDLQWEEQVTFHQKPNAKIELSKPEKTQG